MKEYKDMSQKGTHIYHRGGTHIFHKGKAQIDHEKVNIVVMYTTLS